MREWPGQTKNTEKLDDGFEVECARVLVDCGALRAAVGEELFGLCFGNGLTSRNGTLRTIAALHHQRNQRIVRSWDRQSHLSWQSITCERLEYEKFRILKRPHDGGLEDAPRHWPSDQRLE